MSSQHKALATTEKGVLDVVEAPTIDPPLGGVQIKVEAASLGPFDMYQLDYGFFVAGHGNGR